MRPPLLTLLPLLLAAAALSAEEPADLAALEARCAAAGEKAAGVRGLTLRRKVDVRIVDPKEHAVRLIEETERAFGGELDDVEAFLARFGLTPKGLRLRTALMLFAEQAVGASFNKGVVSLFSTDVPEPLLVHEMTHALQDQNFAWDSQAEQASGLDGMIAFQALLEGDAELTERVFQRPEDLKDAEAAARRLRAESEQAEEQARQSATEFPAVFARTQSFWYTRGEEFVLALHRNGGWAAVNRAWGSPPDSTEQVLHPEKYLARERPVRLDTSGLEAELIADGWGIRYSSTAGELILEVWLEQRAPRPLDATACFRAAAGWGGDRAILAERGKTRLGIWVTTWDSVEDAKEFCLAARRNLRGDEVEEDSDDRTVRRASDGRHAVVRRGADVLVVLGCPKKTLPLVEREAWKSPHVVPVEKK